MIGRVEETSASSKPGPRLDSTRLRGARGNSRPYRNRRECITLVGSAAVAWPPAARGQQAAVSVVGYLGVGSRETDAARLAGLREGLKGTGYVEGQNLAVEYRWGGSQPDRLPALVADLMRIPVALIVTPGLPSTLAAKATTTTVPIRRMESVNAQRLYLER